MKKRALSLLLTLAMVVSLFAGLAMTANAETAYQLASGALAAGDKVIVALKDGDDYYALPNANTSGVSSIAGTALTVTNGIATADSTYTFVVYANGGHLGLKSTESNNYLGLNSNKLACNGWGDTKYLLFADQGNGLYTITSETNSGRGVTTSGTDFACNNSDATPVYIFKLGEEEVECAHENAAPVAAVAATCTTAGNSAYYYCADCDTYFTDSTLETTTTLAAVTIAATGHTWGAWSVTTAATCTEAGEQTRTCSACGATATEAIPAGHNYVDHVCSVCGAKEPVYQLASGTLAEGDYVIVALKDGDDYYALPNANKSNSNTIAGTALTVTNGIATADSTYTFVVYANGGHLGLKSTESNNYLGLNSNRLACNGWGDTKYLTFTDQGNGLYAIVSENNSPRGLSYSGTNFTCNNSGNTPVYIFKLGDVTPVNPGCTHDNAALVAAVAATCTTAGNSAYYYCAACDTYFTDSTLETTTTLAAVTIAATGHTWGAAVDNNNGTHTMTCSVCNAPVTEDCTFEVLEAGGNEFECTVCGYTKEFTQFDKTTTVADGDQVVIYHPTSGKALTATASGAKLAGVEVPSDYYSTTKLCIPDDAVIMTVADYNNGQFHLTIDVNGSTLNLTSGATGNSVSFAAAPTQGETDYGLWEIDTTTGLVLKNVNAAYNGNQQALEVYNNLFTTYQANTTAAFQMELFIACRHENTTLTGCVAATCVDDGYTGDYVCNDCGATVTVGSVIPATGHTFVDGVCTVCGAVDTETIDLKIETASLTLYEDIVVNFAASVPTGLTDPYMIIEINGQSYTVIPNREDSEGRLVFEFTNLTPDMMGDNIKSTVYATTAGGQLVHYCKPTYSVRQYCTNVMAAYPEDAKLQTLLADMLVYGAATQRFTGHNADSLVTAGLDLAAASTFTDPPASDLSMTDTTDANIQWTGAGLECGSRMSMYFTLSTTAGDATSVSVTINGRTTVYEYADIVTDDPTVCRVVFRGISASEYGDVVTAVVKNNGAPVQTLTYSVNSYINSKYNDPNVENLTQLVQAICNYGASASNYIN